MTNTDILIIGGGPGGYVAGIRTAQLGGKVTIIERDNIGGTCLNRGCVPTKILAERTKLLGKLRNFGSETGDVNKSFAELMEMKRQAIEGVVKSTRRLLDSYGIEFIQGVGRITGQGEVEIAGAAGNQHVSARKLIIASGSSPSSLPIPGADSPLVLSGEKILEIKEAPEKLVIIGGGGIGVEFACIFNSIGTKVTILELMPQILPNEDLDMSQFLRQLLESRGIEIYTEAEVREIVNCTSDEVSVRFSVGNQEKEVRGTKVLLSVGRRPNTQNLGLENVDVVLDRGWIKTDNHMRTSNPNIFASGDVAGKYQLAYVAWAEAIVAAENAMGENSEINYSVIPRCTFSDPQLASVGLTETQARSKGYDIKIGAFALTDNSRALALGEQTGGIKIIADADSGEILGAHIMGPEAAELIGCVALAMKLEATVQDLGEMMVIHPTLLEVVKEAALDVDNRSIHRMKKQ